ncbi:MAG TPA: LysM peptidoglycan-binding domain-containing protein [Candidatus Janibacter merdipullorum]|nr:LysM peptidoglycan-binding domain-containing protein [Candidatus Janibacter merdipullorum]
MTALTAAPGHGSPIGAPASRSARSRHLVSVPTGEAVRPRVTGLRITRRGRLAMTTTTLAVASIAGAGMAFGGPGADAPEVTVERGQTLSSIAEAEMAGVPTHEAVTQIQVANDLTSSHVHVGQTLTIPTP